VSGRSEAFLDQAVKAPLHEVAQSTVMRVAVLHLEDAEPNIPSPAEGGASLARFGSTRVQKFIPENPEKI
jgi:hypothetical protein